MYIIYDLTTHDLTTTFKNPVLAPTSNLGDTQATLSDCRHYCDNTLLEEHAAQHQEKTSSSYSEGGTGSGSGPGSGHFTPRLL